MYGQSNAIFFPLFLVWWVFVSFPAIISDLEFCVSIWRLKCAVGTGSQTLEVNYLEQVQYITHHFKRGVGKEYVKHILLDCLETIHWRTKLLNEKWLSMNKEVAYRTILRFSNKDRLRYFSSYLDEVKYKWF
jgi:hypothetical protein